MRNLQLGTVASAVTNSARASGNAGVHARPSMIKITRRHSPKSIAKHRIDALRCGLRAESPARTTKIAVGIDDAVRQRESSNRMLRGFFSSTNRRREIKLWLFRKRDPVVVKRKTARKRKEGEGDDKLQTLHVL
jgi:hypothetical protein